jgi:hypothetical protein
MPLYLRGKNGLEIFMDNRQHEEEYDGVPAPPRILLWGLIGLLILAVVGSIAAAVIFRNVLTTGQQVRVVNMMPFMEALLPPRSTPEGGIVPTAAAPQGGISPEDLLSIPLSGPESTPEVIPTIVEPTNVSIITPTSTWTPPPTPTWTPTPTPPPPTAAPTEGILVPTEPEIVGDGNPAYARLYGFRHEQQTWNNCGPANVTMALSYYGWTQDQTVAAEFLKPGGKEDKNVNPIEMVAFVNEQTAVRAITRIGGDIDLLKAFVARNFPVIIETGYMPEGYDWIGHYRTIVGYDDPQQIFYVYDSFLGVGEHGEGITEAYNVIDDGWQDFNRAFIVIYEPAREGEVREILGQSADPIAAAEHAFEIAQQEARTNPQDGFAWFNMGTALVKLGRYEEAAAAYDRARQVDLPWRALWYQFGAFEAYYEVGRYDDVLSLAEVNLTNSVDQIEEIYYWQGQAYIQKGMVDEAANSFRLALRRNPRYTAAKNALDALS